MTKREIMELIKHHERSKTFSAYYAGHGFHSTDLEALIRELDALICQVPGCDNERCERNGRKAYLCPKHLSAAMSRGLEH